MPARDHLPLLLCEKLGIAGEIRVIGCPREEILWGKIALLKAGCSTASMSS